MEKIQALLILIARLLGLYREKVQQLPPIPPAPRIVPSRSPGQILFETAKGCIGLDMSPKENEFGCAEAVNAVVYKAFGEYAGGDLSTYRLWVALSGSRKFKRVKESAPGDIIISPTGTGNGTLANGHTGIVGENQNIMSSDSTTGLWSENYTLRSWGVRYHIGGGFPIYFFRRV